MTPRMLWGVPGILNNLESPKEEASAFSCSFNLFERNKELGSAWSGPPLPPDTSHNEASVPWAHSLGQAA